MRVLDAQGSVAPNATELTKVATSAVPDPSLQSSIGDGKPALVLSAASAEKKVDAQVGFAAGPTQMTLKLSAPLDSGATTATLATLDGLTNQSTADLGLTWVKWNPSISPQTFEDLCNAFKRTLTPEVMEKYAPPGFTVTPVVIRDRQAFADSIAFAASGSAFADLAKLLRAALKEADLKKYFADKHNLDNSANWKKVLDALNSSLDSATLFAESSAFPDEASVANLRVRLRSASLTPQRTRVLNRLLFDALFPATVLRRGPDDPSTCSELKLPPSSALYQLIRTKEGPMPLFFAAHAKGGRQSFKYFDEKALSTNTTLKNSYSLSATAGLLTHSDLYLGMSATYQNTFKAGDAVQICAPVGASANQECTALQRNAPAEKLQTILQLEGRVFLVGGHFAINPLLSYECHAATKGVEVRFLFLQDKDGGLTGGLSTGWRSDTRQYSVIAFVGEKLNLVPTF